MKGEDDRLCLLIIIGVNEQGEKRLLALSDGYRDPQSCEAESKASWLARLPDLTAGEPKGRAEIGHRRRCLGLLGGLE